MKKLHAMGCILLLFAIWLNTFPHGSSDIPELLSLISAAAGVGLGAAAFFEKDK